MYIIVLTIALLLVSGAARAFDCVGVRLPSTIVICSSRQLMRLADERQAAINDARARIGEERWPALWEDQQAWVRSYATACGIPPERPPPQPVSGSVIACFEQAGMARIAYLRSYGLAAASAAAPSSSGFAGDRIGPSFDCGKASSALPLLICADPGLSFLDLRFNQAYWALYQQVGPAGQPGLKEQDLAFINRVLEVCQIPASGALTQPTPQSRDCVSEAYEKMREAWLARLSGPAHEEAARPLRTHIALQGALQDLGFMPAGPIDGVYGATTRAAIAQWQSAHGFVVTGVLGDAEARAIVQELESRQAAVAPERQAPRDWSQGGFSPTISPEAGSGGAPQQSKAPYIGSALRIPMERVGGVYTVPVLINGQITLNFTVDSGATDVQLPADVALTLIRTGTLSPDDFIGKETYTLANGSELKSARFIIHELKVGNYTATNVPASIGSVQGDLLLGQSFLSRFASWTVDNDRHALVLGEPSR